MGKESTASTCPDGTAISTGLTSVICDCPLYPSIIAPCTCGASTGSTTTLTISCSNKGVNETTLPPILAQLPATTPIDTYDFSSNQFTTFDASWFNANTASSQKTVISFKSNQITKIEANPFGWTTFPQSVSLILSGNPFTYLNETALTPILNQYQAGKLTGGGMA